MVLSMYKILLKSEQNNYKLFLYLYMNRKYIIKDKNWIFSNRIRIFLYMIILDII